MFGDPHYELLAASTLATSSNAAHSLFNDYGGLSDLNPDDVVNLWVEVESGNKRAALTPSVETSATFRFTLDDGTGYIEFKPMRAAAASRMHVFNADANSDTQVEWILWRRVG